MDPTNLELFNVLLKATIFHYSTITTFNYFLFRFTSVEFS